MLNNLNIFGSLLKILENLHLIKKKKMGNVLTTFKQYYFEEFLKIFGNSLYGTGQK